MSERDEFTDTSPITAVEDHEGAGGRGPDEDPDEFVVRALERAQRVARNHGYIRSTLPSWASTKPAPGAPSMDPANTRPSKPTDSAASPRTAPTASRLVPPPAPPPTDT